MVVQTVVMRSDPSALWGHQLHVQVDRNSLSTTPHTVALADPLDPAGPPRTAGLDRAPSPAESGPPHGSGGPTRLRHHTAPRAGRLVVDRPGRSSGGRTAGRGRW